MFSSRNKKNIDTFWLKKAPYQELCDSSGENAYTDLIVPDKIFFWQKKMPIFFLFHNSWYDAYVNPKVLIFFLFLHENMLWVHIRNASARHR